MTKASPDSHFVVTYRDPAQLIDKEIVTLNVRTVGDSDLGLGFVRISDFIFDEGSSLIVDPTVAHLKARFENTKSLHISLYNILSIEEVGEDHKGLTFVNKKSNIYMMPQHPES